MKITNMISVELTQKNETSIESYNLDDVLVKNAFNVELRNRFEILSNKANEDDPMNLKRVGKCTMEQI
jgi:hypothetical protein